jgi:PAS domain S-box-containing protein
MRDNDFKTMEADLKASEQRYKTLPENSPVGIYIFEDWKIKFANKALAEMSGYTKEELLNIDFLTLIHPDYRDTLVKQTMRALTGDVSDLPTNHEIQVIQKNGDCRWIQIRPNLVNYSGRAAVLGCIIDVTDQRNMEERVRALYQKAKRQSKRLVEEAKVKNLFIDMLAHELRTPLTAVLSSSSLLQETSGISDDIKQRLASNIQDGATVLAKRLDELLDVARFSKGTFKLQKQSIDTRVFTEEVVDRFKPSLTDKGQCIKLTIVGDLPRIYADQSRLEQVIVNLLSNASKYSPQKSSIGITAMIKNNKFVVEVKDEGIGIDREDLGKMFQAYHRVGKSGNVPGTGLGLYIAKQIVKAHGGKIWVTSQLDKGSTFSISIPVEGKD